MQVGSWKCDRCWDVSGGARGEAGVPGPPLMSAAVAVGSCRRAWAHTRSFSTQQNRQAEHTGNTHSVSLSRVFTASHTFSHAPHHPSNVSWKIGFKGIDLSLPLLGAVLSQNEYTRSR